MSGRPSEWVRLEFVAELIRGQGYKALPCSTDPSVIESEVAGYKSYVLLYPPSDLQWAISFLKSDDRPFELSVINEVNSAFRFAKLSVDEDGDLMVQADFSMASVPQSAAAEVLLECLQLWEDAVPDVLARLEQPAGSASGQPG